MHLPQLLLVILTGTCISVPEASGKQESRKARLLLQSVFKALERGIAFYKEEFARVNFDALIGTRMIEGQLEVVLQHIANGSYPGVTSDIASHIQQIINKSLEFSNLAQPIIAQDDPDYQDLKAWILPGLWNKLDYPNRLTDSSFATEAHFDDEALDNWDDCNTEIMAKNCVISKGCKEKMYGEGYILYSLSHQLIYLELGEGTRCFKGEALKEHDLYANEYCANMLIDGKDIVAKNFTAHFMEDYWMEIQALCGVVGFQDFFNSDWLKQILKWQWPQGCWGNGLPHKGHKRRVKRTERHLTGGCLSHKTSVALDALGQYVRYILDYMYKQNMPHFEFFPQTY